MSVIENFFFPATEKITQFSGQVKMRLIWQLIKRILKLIQKLLNYFNGTAILTSLVLPAAAFCLIILILTLSDSEFTILSFGSSL